MTRQVTIKVENLRVGNVFTEVVSNLPARVVSVRRNFGGETVEVSFETYDSIVMTINLPGEFDVLVEEKVNRCASTHMLGPGIPMCRCQRTEHLTGRHFNDEGALPMHWG